MSREMNAKIGIAAASLGLGALAGHFLPNALAPQKVDNGAINYSVREVGIHLTISKGTQPEAVSGFMITLEQPGTYNVSVSQPGDVHGVMNDRIDVLEAAQTRNFEFSRPVHDAIFTIVKVDRAGAEKPILYASARGARLAD